MNDKMLIEEVLTKLRSLQRYDMWVRGCDCCGQFVESEPDDKGEWVNYSDIETIIALIGNRTK